MKIGVLSDTHDLLPLQVMDALREMDEIWHLGDVCQPHIIHSLASLKIPLHGVSGNCDSHGRWPQSLTLERCGKVFFLIHIPLEQAPDGVDVLLHGHTHVPRDEIMAGCRFINPGAVGGADKGASHGFGVMRLDERGQIRWQQIQLN
jgi:hypothetical protein